MSTKGEECMINWLLSWFMPDNVALKGFKQPSEAKTEANLGVGSFKGK
jgi:hypothetical protein